MRHIWHKVYLGIGSNLGNRGRNVEKSLRLLEAEKEIRVKKQSSLYKTKPVGGPKQRDFKNGVVLIETTLAVKPLLKVIKSIENKLGRKKGAPRWGPRVIDLDILVYEQLVLKSKLLSVPHPRMHKRFFVLAPFAQIASRFKHPLLNKTVGKLLSELESK
ncbi:MAG: 2-amino-4-hydroxy-6-hydroxymethyldihydropteridine diphosphokinase [Candidatus Omnitrophica bacterium]|nr:2-amino-4-hydroxy-6-hydroxymethyldihydropteridine diphosphokinase [Candidatus Omnitrophota bacterium]